MNNKPILAFDCAAPGASISLRVDGQTVTHLLPQGRQAAELVPVIDELMRDAALIYQDLGALVTTVGPGSFTGVRIGLAAAHGFVLVAHTPLKTLTTLTAMAWHVAHTTAAPARFFVALRAGKGEVYAQAFRLEAHTPLPTGEIFLAPEAYQNWDAPCFSNMLAVDDPLYLAGPNTETLCAVADRLNQTSLAAALPLYIRPPDAVVPKQAAWLSGPG